MNRTSGFRALSAAILRGFLRDRTAVFFAVVFPLMFLVLFGGLFSDQSQGKVELIEVGSVPLFDDLPPEARAAFDETFTVTRSDDLDAALDQVRKGDANVAVVQDGDTLVAHYTLADPAGAAITRGAMQSFIDGANVAATGQPPTYDLQIDPVEDESLDAIQYYTPGLLGWAVAMSAAFGAAATLQGWRQSKLLRRLQLAPVSTRTVVGARVSVTVAVAPQRSDASIASAMSTSARGAASTTSRTCWVEVPSPSTSSWRHACTNRCSGCSDRHHRPWMRTGTARRWNSSWSTSAPNGPTPSVSRSRTGSPNPEPGTRSTTPCRPSPEPPALR